MKINYFVIICIILTIFLPCGNSIQIDADQQRMQKGSPGSTIQYQLNVTNNRMYNVDIKAEIVPNSQLQIYIVNSEFINVYLSQTVSFLINVTIPYGASLTSIEFYVSISERPNMLEFNENINNEMVNYQTHARLRYICIVTEESESEMQTHFVLFASFIIICCALSGYVVNYVYKINKKLPFSSLAFDKSPFFPIISIYTRLRRDRILKNPIRNNIMVYLKERKNGASFKDIQHQINITHPSYLNYHLRRMMEFGFIRRVDNDYFHKSAPLKKSFLREIHEAIEMGDRTPTEVANRIKSYPQKVRYHMDKHGLLTVCDVDYSKRKK